MRMLSAAQQSGRNSEKRGCALSAVAANTTTPGWTYALRKVTCMTAASACRISALDLLSLAGRIVIAVIENGEVAVTMRADVVVPGEPAALAHAEVGPLAAHPPDGAVLLADLLNRPGVPWPSPARA